MSCLERPLPRTRSEFAAGYKARRRPCFGAAISAGVSRFVCASGRSIRATSIRRVSLHCGARLCWHEPCCAVELEAIDTIRSWCDFSRIPVPATRSVRISLPVAYCSHPAMPSALQSD